MAGQRLSLAGSTSSLSSPPASASDPDSDLTDLSATPSPPSSPTFAHKRPQYISPSSSQSSSAKTSPAPDNMRPTPPSSDNDGPARKRRKLSEPKERTTKHLDLTKDHVENDPQLKRVLEVLQKKRKIVVIAGAGISVSAGIPDFRSSGGLFSSLRKHHKLKSSGKDLFDASVYRDDSSTSSFHDMVRSLSEKTKEAQPTPFHHLLAKLADEGRLLRLYSQNVDGIDISLPPLKTQVPLPKKAPWPKTVQLHGGLDHMVCSKCHTLSKFEAEKFNGPLAPECEDCTVNDQVRQVASKRSHGIGRLRPRMVLYNEHNPDDEAIGSCASHDLRVRPDAVIVAGTTLKVPGVRRIAREMCAVVRDRRDGVAIWINNDPEPVGKDLANSWDIVVKGPCDEIARHAAMARWDDPTIFKEVTDDEINKTKEKQRPVVLVPMSTPKKMTAIAQVQMPTPGASPRMEPRASKGDTSTPSKTSGRKRKSIEPKVKAPAKPTKRQPQKKASAKRKPKIESQKMTNHFNVSKSATSGRALEVVKKEAAFIPSQPKSENRSEFPSNMDDEDALPPLPEPTRTLPISSAWIPPSPSTIAARLSSRDSFNKPDTEPFTSQPCTPQPQRSINKYAGYDDSRPSTASSRKDDTIVPPEIPRGMGDLLHG